MFVMFKHDVEVLKNHHQVVDIKKVDESHISVAPEDRGFNEPSVYCSARTAERNFLELVDDTPVDERWFRDTIGFGNKFVRWGDITIEYFEMNPDAGEDRNGVVVCLVIPAGPDREEGDPEEYTRDIQALFTRGEALQFCNVIMGKKMVK